MMIKMEEEPKDISLIVFFTLGLSLKKWDDLGSLSREIELYNRLSKYFQNIYLFTYGDNSELKYKNLLKENIIIVPNRYNLNPYLYSFISPIINIDIITQHSILKTNQIIGGWTALLAKSVNKNNKLVVRSGYIPSLLEKVNGNTIKYKFFKFIERVLFKSSDISIVTSTEAFFYVSKYTDNVKLITNHIDTEKFKPIKIKKNNRILFIGRITRIKNLKNLVLALDKICIGLDIIGNGNNKFKKELKTIAKLKKIDIKFLGNKKNEDLPRIINSYSLFVLPSIREGMPKTLLEAMSCGMPCIGTNVFGIREVISNGKNGILCGTASEDLYNAIILIINNNELKNKISSNARKSIKDNYSLDIIEDLEVKVYTELTK